MLMINAMSPAVITIQVGSINRRRMMINTFKKSFIYATSSKMDAL